jgi:predicted aminopeptidase
MRITIVTGDKLVGVDGVFRKVENIQVMFPLVRAVQWYGTTGTVEFIDRSISNSTINNISEYQQAIDAWTALAPISAPPDYGDLNYKALIRRQADDLGNAGQYWEAIKLLKTIGE